MDLERRELLRQIAALLAGMGAASLASCKRDPKSATPDARAQARAPDAGAWKEGDHALLPAQRVALGAAVARILPADQDPGAAEADVIEFIDRELARPEYDVLKTNLLAGLTALNNHARRGGGKLFVDLAPAEQDQVLHQVQRASDRGKDFVFFLTVLTLEGFFGDPQWGGNAGGVGWGLSGYGPGTVSGEVGDHDHH